MDGELSADSCDELSDSTLCYHEECEQHAREDEDSFLGEAGTISFTLITESLNFVLVDIAYVFIIGCFKMLMDFLVKPAVSLYQKGIAAPLTLLRTGALFTRNIVVSISRASKRLFNRSTLPQRRSKLYTV